MQISNYNYWETDFICRPPNSRYNLNRILLDSWVIDLRINNHMEILKMLSKNEAEFMLNNSKEELESIVHKIEYLTSDMARTGRDLCELIDKKKTTESIINKVTEALKDGK